MHGPYTDTEGRVWACMGEETIGPYETEEEARAAMIEAGEPELFPVTATGHLIGAVYRDAYWGGTYRVLGEDASGAVEVECVEPGAGAHNTPGARWTHRTMVGKDAVVAYPARA